MKHSNTPTLQLIAERAGVSKMTVSRILRNYPHHNPATRERVLRAAEELHYRQNPLISALMTNLRHKKPITFRAGIALIQCDPIGRPVHPNRINLRNGIHEEANLKGFEVEGFHINRPSVSAERLLQVIATRGYGCLIFEPFLKDRVKLNIQLEKFSSISITHSLVSPCLDRVEPDHFSGFLLAIEKLTEKGYDRFGFITSPLSLLINENRRRAAFLLAQEKVLKKNRVPLLSLEGDADDRIQLDRWIKKHKPDVLLSSLQEIPQHLLDLGYKVPEDFGYINLGLFDKNSGFAGVNPHWHEVGIIAARQVVDTLISNTTGPPVSPKVTLIQPYWMEGDSLPQKLAPSQRNP